MQMAMAMVLNVFKLRYREDHHNGSSKF